MSFASAIAQAGRTLRLRACGVTALGESRDIPQSDILSCDVSAGAPDGQLLGAVLSRACGVTLSGAQAEYASVSLYLQAHDGASWQESPLCAFNAESAVYDRPGGVTRLSGHDLSLSGAWTDDLVYPMTMGALLEAVCARGGLSVQSAGLPNAQKTIPSRPDWGKRCTLRQALSHILSVMGCFALCTRTGAFAVKRVHAPDASAYEIPRARYETCRIGKTAIGPIGAVAYGQTVVKIDPDAPVTSAQTLTLWQNPILDGANADVLLTGLLQSVSGYTLRCADVAWQGDPALCVGDKMSVALSDDETLTTVCAQQTLRFDRGFAMQSACPIPQTDAPRPVLCSGGGVLTDGLDGGLLRARSVQTQALAAGCIAADSGILGSACIDTAHIKDLSVTGAKLADASITNAKIDSLSADKITAGQLTTDRLIVGGTELSIVRAINALSGGQSSSSIDGAAVTDGSITVSKVSSDFGQGLELSSNQAVLLLSGKLDGTNSHMELTQDAVNIQGGEVNIATDDLEIRGLQNGRVMMALNPTELFAPVVSAERVMGGNLVSLCELSGDVNVSGGIGACLPKGKYLAQDVTLHAGDAQYVEDIVLSGYVGQGALTLDLTGASLHGGITVRNCACPVRIKGGTVLSVGETGVLLADCASVRVDGTRVIGSARAAAADASRTKYAVRILRCAHADVAGLCAERADSAVYVANSRVSLAGVIGGAQSESDYRALTHYAFVASGHSVCSVSPPVPIGAKGAYLPEIFTPRGRAVWREHACARTTAASPYASVPMFGTPVSYTAQDAYTAGGTGIASHHDIDLQWTNQGVMLLGRTYVPSIGAGVGVGTSISNRYAYYLMTNAAQIASDIAAQSAQGKTLVGASVTVTRENSYGQQGAVSLTLVGHGLSAPYAQGAYSPSDVFGQVPVVLSDAVSLQRGQTAVVSLNEGALTLLASGAVKGFGGCCATGDMSAQYLMALSKTAALTLYYAQEGA